METKINKKEIAKLDEFIEELDRISKSTESKMNLVRGMEYGILFGLLGSLFIALNYDLWIKDLSVHFKILLSALSLFTIELILYRFTLLIYDNKTLKKDLSQLLREGEIFIKSLNGKIKKEIT